MVTWSSQSIFVQLWCVVLVSYCVCFGSKLSSLKKSVWHSNPTVITPWYCCTEHLCLVLHLSVSHYLWQAVDFQYNNSDNQLFPCESFVTPENINKHNSSIKELRVLLSVRVWLVHMWSCDMLMIENQSSVSSSSSNTYAWCLVLGFQYQSPEAPFSSSMRRYQAAAFF